MSTLVLLALWTNTLHAQESGMTLTVTPPLIQVNLQPGEVWSSGIQVVNNNTYDITVFSEPVLFEPAGEDGRPRFKTAPGVEGEAGTPDPTTLAGWITVPREAQSIPPEQTITIPLTIQVPIDASPGGHYSAILIGNRAPEGVRGESSVSVTSSIASLIFLRVAGTVIEDGRIRDFATEKMLYENAEAQLSLRFENQGNVHLQPRGEITIYNMFGKKRGSIAVNQSGDYGNVLPGSLRKFTYTWKADASTWDIGRYRAEATLGYGAESKSFAQATTYFYILPLIPLAEVLLGTLALILFIGWALRTYVRKAIALETRQLHQGAISSIEQGGVPDSVAVHPPVDPKVNLKTLMHPIHASFVDLRRVSRTDRRIEQTKRVEVVPAPSVHTAQLPMGEFLYRYRYFFIFVGVLGVAWVLASALFADVLTYERPYEVRTVTPTDEVVSQGSLEQ
jgi:hypothetical protein